MSNSTSTGDDELSAELSDSLKIVTVVLIVVFPLFMLYCQWLLHTQRTTRVIRKRSMTAIRVASLVPGWLSWLNLIISMDLGIPCMMFYIFALLIAPLSIGPQLNRAIRLWSMFKLAHLVLDQDVLSIKRKVSKRSGTSTFNPTTTDTAVKSAIEVTVIKKATKIALNVVTWGLLVFPTTCLLIISMVLSDEDDLMEDQFAQCFPEPTVVRFFSPANGLFVAFLAIIACFVLRHSADELGIRTEITRNVVIWATTYIIVLILRSEDLGRIQPILISLQQMMLTYSMIILPCGGFHFHQIKVYSGEGSSVSYRQSAGSSPSYRSSGR